MKRKSYIGNPYMNSNRTARIYTSMSAATKAAKRLKNESEIYEIGKGMFVIKVSGKKYYEK